MPVPRSPLSSRALIARARVAAIAALVAPVLLVGCGPSDPKGAEGPAGASPAAIPSTRPPGSPEAVFDRTKHDFGLARQGADLSTQFRLENKGGSPLHVKALNGNCGCITGVAKATTIAPGAATEVEVTFHTYAMVGPLSKWIQVTTDDPMRPITMLEASVDISAGVVIEPANFYFPLTLVGTTPEPSMVVKWKEGVGRPFSIAEVAVSGVDAEGVARLWSSPPWKGWEVTLRFRSPPPLGMVSGRATIRTDSSERPSIEALVGGQVSGRVWLTQREVSFGVAPRGKGGRIEVLVKGFDSSVDLGEVTAAAERGRVAALAVRGDEKGTWKVLILLPENAPSGPIEDRVRVTTAVPGEETLTIAVVGVVAAGSK
jgi:hypothetical protein